MTNEATLNIKCQKGEHQLIPTGALLPYCAGDMGDGGAYSEPCVPEYSCGKCKQRGDIRELKK